MRRCPLTAAAPPLGGEDGSVTLLDLRSGERRTLAGRHEDIVQQLAFSADGRTLATSGDDGRVLVWDLRRGDVRETLTGHSGRITSLTVERRRAHALHRWAGRPDHRLGHRRRPPPRASLPGRRAGSSGYPPPLAVSPSGETVAAGLPGGGVRLHDARSLRRLSDLPGLGKGPVTRRRVQPRRADGRRDRRGRHGRGARRVERSARARTAAWHGFAGAGDGVLARRWPARRRGSGRPLAGHRPEEREGPQRVAVPRVRASPVVQPRWQAPGDRTRRSRHRAARQPYAADRRPTAPRQWRRRRPVGSVLPRWTPARCRAPTAATRSCGTSPATVAPARPWPATRGSCSTRSSHRTGGCWRRAGPTAPSSSGTSQSRRTLGTLPGLHGWVAARFTPDGRRLFVLHDLGGAQRWEVTPAMWSRHACRVAGRELTRTEWEELAPDQDYRSVCSR